MNEKIIVADKKYLLIPVADNGGWFSSIEETQFLRILRDGILVEEYELQIARNPRCWGCLYLERYRGEKLIIQVEGGDETLLDLLEVSDILKDAGALYCEKTRPFVHFTAMHGFMNDPNGLFYYKGTYHYFAQLNPYGFGAGNTHWLHAVSKDLLHWKELPYALLPDESGRMYSGSAVVDYENTSGIAGNDEIPIFLFYTSAGSKSRWSRGRYFEVSIAISTNGGMTFCKHQGNPIVKHIAFMNRDPKVVWNPGEKCWIMGLFLDNSRYMLLYSEDLFHWKEGQVIEIKGSAECPDLFCLPLDNDQNQMKWIIWGSPDNYIVGTMNGRQFNAETDTIRGPSYMTVSAYKGFARVTGSYAAQTYFGVPNGRVIQQSWIQTKNYDAPFSSCTSLPNDLRLISTSYGPRLSVLPSEEVKMMYENGFSFKNRGLEELERIPLSYCGECMDMTFGFSIQGSDLIAVSVRGVLVVYDPRNGILMLPNGAFLIGTCKDRLNFRVITDRCSVELYTCDGLFNTVLNTVLDPSNIEIKPVFLDPSTAIDFELHRLRNTWTDRQQEAQI
jgi:levanase/fructan beta-fructosidase